MKILYATLERNEDGFTVFTENSLFSGLGSTSEEAKADMLEQMKFYKETCIHEGLKYPSYLDSDYEIQYKFDIVSLLTYYDKIISRASLEKLSGINQRQLGHYIQGVKKPRIAQQKKIETALHNLGKELLSISI
jgi:hypothetical protein